MNANFRARYSGQCAHGDLIEVGDLCTYTKGDQVAHVDCEVEDAQDGERFDPSSVCPDCWTVHAGECA